jgi:hypothetical protein
VAPVSELPKPSSTKRALATANAALAETEAKLQTTLETNVSLYKGICVERHKVQPMAVRKKILDGQINFLQAVELPTARGDAAKAVQLLQSKTSDNEHLKHELSRLLERCTLEASQSETKQMDLNAKVAAVKKQNRTLQKHCNQAPEIKAKAVKYAKKLCQ